MPGLLDAATEVVPVDPADPARMPVGAPEGAGPCRLAWASQAESARRATQAAARADARGLRLSLCRGVPAPRCPGGCSFVATGWLGTSAIYTRAEPAARVIPDRTSGTIVCLAARRNEPRCVALQDRPGACEGEGVAQWNDPAARASTDKEDSGVSRLLAVSSPAGVPVWAWAWTRAGASDTEGVAVARVTLRALGGEWVLAETQEPLPANPGEIAQWTLPAERRTQVVLPEDESPVVAPIAPDAEILGSSRGRLRLGRVSLLSVGEGPSKRARFEIVALRRAPQRGRILLDLRATLRWPVVLGGAAPTPRFALAIQSDGELTDALGTSPAPGVVATSALPFPSSPKDHPSTPGPLSPLERSSPAPAARPGQAQTMSMPVAAGLFGGWSVAAPQEPGAPRFAPAPPPIAPPERLDAVVAAPRSAAEASDRVLDPQLGTPQSPGVEAPARALDLVWSAPGCSERVRADPSWRRLLREAEEVAYADEVSAEPTAEVDAKRALITIARTEKPTPPGAWPVRLREAFAEEGALRTPLLLVRGELAFDFDRRARLEAYVAATRALHKDERFAPVWKEAAELSREAGPFTPAEDLTEQTAALLVAFDDVARTFSHDELDRRVHQALSERRAFHALEIGGAPHARARIVTEDGSTGVLYLPDTAVRQLPPAPRLGVTAFLALSPREEPALADPAIGKVLAIARHAPGQEPGRS